MLCLSRFPGERITIHPLGDAITVEVLCVKPNGAVRLGITAPKGVPVHREEVSNAIKAAQGYVDRGEIAKGRDVMDHAENLGVPVADSDAAAREV